MVKQPTTIRLEKGLRDDVLREARKAGLDFSGIVHLLLLAFVRGDVHVGVLPYPKGYLETLGREAEELRSQHRKGKTKRYTSSKELFDAILER